MKGEYGANTYLDMTLVYENSPLVVSLAGYNKPVQLLIRPALIVFKG